VPEPFRCLNHQHFFTVEAGGNKVLTGMVKRIDKDLQTISIDTPADIEAFGKGL